MRCASRQPRGLRSPTCPRHPCRRGCSHRQSGPRHCRCLRAGEAGPASVQREAGGNSLLKQTVRSDWNIHPASRDSAPLVSASLRLRPSRFTFCCPPIHYNLATCSPPIRCNLMALYLTACHPNPSAPSPGTRPPLHPAVLRGLPTALPTNRSWPHDTHPCQKGISLSSSLGASSCHYGRRPLCLLPLPAAIHLRHSSLPHSHLSRWNKDLASGILGNGDNS